MEERILVSVRLRALNQKEILSNDVSDWECVNDTTIVYKNADLLASERSMHPTAYVFDKVFNHNCSTRKVYEDAAKEMTLSVLEGFNSSVFAYGQTSSGKTYTMTGITEYAISDIYQHAQKQAEREYVLKFSAMEIYNESVRDLLCSDTPLRLLDDPERGTVVEKLSEETVRDWDHVIHLLSICEAQRQIGETKVNQTSSRSHQIIRLTVESCPREFSGIRHSPNTLIATVNFVDLAGSERVSQSLSAGTRLKEGCHINRSLLTLGTVIRKLCKGSNEHIPFRDSKLTRILQPSLGGNAKTAIICTLSPARSHVEQSRNTLLFASCAKEVTNNAYVNVVMSDKVLLKHLQRELARLEGELRSPRSSLQMSDNAALMQEKDIQIEKLEKEIRDLKLDRDIAQTQVRDLLQLLEDDRKSVLQIGDDESSVIRVGVGYYPNLRVQRSDAADAADDDDRRHMPIIGLDEADVRTCSDNHSRSSSEDQFTHVPGCFEESFLGSNSSRPVVVSSLLSFSESDSCRGWDDDDLEKQSDRVSEDLCKEVRCVDIEKDLDVNEEVVPLTARVCVGDISVPSESVPMEADCKLEFATSSDESMNPNQELVLHMEVATPSSKAEKGLTCNCFPENSPINQFPLHELSMDSSDMRITISRSCEESLVNDSFTPRNRAVDCTDSNTIPHCFNANTDKRHFPSSTESYAVIQLEASQKENSSHEDTETKELAVSPNEEEDPDCCVAVMETEPEGNEPPFKTARDDGLDPIEDEIKGLTSWPSEFKKLQKQILELWHDCNVSLVHRTYFFLLFQGDTTDALYMEVERRRLCFLKDTFTRMNKKTDFNGRTLSLEQSLKDLQAEKRMLMKQMRKKLTEQERESLYLKWGITLNSKLRRAQLANRLWSSTDDMNHITDSAYLIARLIRFMDIGQAPKEIFGLDFGFHASPSYSFKRSLISLL